MFSIWFAPSNCRENFRNADSIIIYGDKARYHTNKLASYLNSSRSPHTRFIFWSRESPVQIAARMNQTVFQDLFDLTMKYRRDSDIYTPYVMRIVKWNPSNWPTRFVLSIACRRNMYLMYISLHVSPIGWDLCTCIPSYSNPFYVCTSYQFALGNPYIRWLYPNNKLSLVLSIQVVRVRTLLFFHLYTG